MEPDPVSKGLTVVSLHPGVSREQVERATGWPIRFLPHLEQTPEPGPGELETLRALKARTAAAHGTE
jgi:glutaconate CoA-transferase subunit B